MVAVTCLPGIKDKANSRNVLCKQRQWKLSELHDRKYAKNSFLHE